jgi:hypothetical protein
MIEADGVDVSEQGAHPVEAPAVPVRGQRLPVIDRIAPALSRRAEIVGRYTGHHARPVLSVDKKELRVRPDVARVRGDKEREIADKSHAPGTGVALEARPLPKQQELTESNLVDLVGQVAPRLLERGPRAADELFRPLEIGGAVVPGLERAEQGVIVEPVTLFLAEAFEAGLQI